jgi:hypothetical protein
VLSPHAQREAGRAAVELQRSCTTEPASGREKERYRQTPREQQRKRERWREGDEEVERAGDEREKEGGERESVTT